MIQIEERKMKTAIIMSSAVSEFGRMDAGFHLLNKEHEVRIAELKQSLTLGEAREVAQEMFDAIPAQHRRLLEPLVRTSSIRNADGAMLNRALEEYPYQSIAVFQAAQAAIRTTLEAKIAEAEADRNRLNSQLEKVTSLTSKAKPRGFAA